MNEGILNRLEALKARMEANDEAFGPDTVISDDESAAGEGGAENVTDTGTEAFENYLLSIIAGLVEEYEMDEEEALDFVLFVADALAEEGDLPPLPDEDDDGQGAAEWLGAATSMVFGDLVFAALEAELEGEDEEDEEEVDEE